MRGNSKWLTSGSGREDKYAACRMIGALLIIALLTLGCIGERQQPGQGSVEAPKEVAVTRELLPNIALRESDFPRGGWVPATTNASGETYEVKFFLMEFGFGGMSTVVNKVHYYANQEDADRDFTEATTGLAAEIKVKEAGVGRNSTSWERLNEAYIMFVEKNIVVELYLNSQNSYNLDYLKGLAKKLEERI